MHPREKHEAKSELAISLTRLRIPMMAPTYSEQSTPMRSDNSTPTILRCAGGVDKSPARGLGQAG